MKEFVKRKQKIGLCCLYLAKHLQSFLRSMLFFILFEVTLASAPIKRCQNSLELDSRMIMIY